MYVCMYIVLIGHKFSAKSQKTFSGSQCSTKQGNVWFFFFLLIIPQDTSFPVEQQAHARKERICVV